MRVTSIAFWLVLCLTMMAVCRVPGTATAQERGAKKSANYPPRMPGSRGEVYKQVGDVSLKLFVYRPAERRSGETPAAVVFFFGGGWQSGTPEQFRPHCEYLASRGMVAIAADYRVASRHQVKAAQCVADAKSAVRWIRTHAGELGIDPKRIVAAGGSAGGHLAAATATLPGFDEPTEDSRVSSRPNALVLFNPALVLAPLDGLDPQGFGTRVGAERLGAEPESLSPAHHVGRETAPAIIFHGRADTTVPFATALAFADQMKKVGTRCELVGYEGQPHGFFNYGRGDNRYFRETVTAMDRFLVSLGYLRGEPTVDTFLQTPRR